MLVAILTPFVRLHEIVWEPFRRLWRLAKLRGRISIDTSNVLIGPIHVLGSGRIRIQGGGYFYRDIHLETQADGHIEIGEGVVISAGTHVVSFYRIEIGETSLIGEYCSIRDANHRTGTEQPVRDAGHEGAPITIGRNVWIGRGCCLLAGVTIGDNAVIGANSVVTKSIPTGAIAVGSPAKVIGQVGGL